MNKEEEMIVIEIIRESKLKGDKIISDAEIAKICQAQGINVNEKYIERMRKKINIKITAPRGGARRSKKNDDDEILKAQHFQAVIQLSKRKRYTGGLWMQTADPEDVEYIAQKHNYSPNIDILEMARQRAYQRRTYISGGR